MLKMGQFKIITEKKEWDEVISNIKEKDIFYTYDFMDITKAGDDEIRLFYYVVGENYAVYPVYLRKIPNLKFLKENDYDSYFDIASAEFGGPIFHIRDKNAGAFIEEFFKQFEGFCRNNNIISEFCRLGAFNKHKEEITKKRRGECPKTTVIVDLTKNKSVLENEIRRERRKKIRKSLRGGVEIKNRPNPKIFHNIYSKTRNRSNAASRFIYDLDFLEELLQRLGDNVTIFFAFKEKKPIASLLLLHYGDFVHNFLSCSLEDYLKFYPNDLLKYHGIMWAKDNGFKSYSLGGGLKGNDELYKYKTTFSSTTTSRCIYKKVYNKRIYNELVDIKNKFCPERYDASFFPIYRNEND